MINLRRYTGYKTILSVNALIWANGKVLLLKRADDKEIDPGTYSGIGGKVEPGEDFYSAILREIKEETGLEKFETIKPYSVTQHPYPPTKAEWVNVYFYVTIPEQVKIPPNEDGEFFWFRPKEVETLPTPDDVKDYVKILTENPSAFVLGFFDHDESGKLTKKIVTVF